MNKTRFTKTTIVPSISTKKSSPSTTNFAKGINTYKPNDTTEADELHLAQDARFDRIGEYKTRRGMTKLCDPIGKEQIFQNISANYDLISLEDLAEDTGIIDYPLEDNAVICSIRVALTGDSNYGVPTMSLVDENGTEVAKSCISSDIVTENPAIHEFFFNQAPDANKQYRIVISLQEGGTKELNIGIVTGKLMCEIFTAPKGEITSIFEANLSDSTGSLTDKSILFSFRKAGDTSGYEKVYRMDEGFIEEFAEFKTDGRPIRYSQDASTIRCVFGEKLYALTPTTIGEWGWKVSKIPITDLETQKELNISFSNIMGGTQDNLIYFDRFTNTQLVWSYPYGTIYEDKTYQTYDEFDSDFHQNLPSLNSGDPLTAMVNMGGIIYVFTRRHKYAVSFETVKNWTQTSCAADHGAFSQEAVVAGENYIYHANDEGIYVFDGYNESSLTKNTIQNVYDSFKNKEKIRLEVHDNRLYVLMPGENNEPGVILVYNTNLKLWESFDANIYVSAMLGRKSPTNRFICGHSRMGLLMLAEDEDNEYNDLGAPLHFELQTAYQHFGTPSQLKRITKWRPEFATTNKPYSVLCGYALEYSDEVKYSYSISLKDGKTYLNETWVDPNDYGVKPSPTRMTTVPRVYKQFRRAQIRYQHIGAFEPVNFKSHTLTIQTQRIR